MSLIRTLLPNHIRASSRENGCTNSQTHDRTRPHRHHAKSALDAGAPSTHDPTVNVRAYIVMTLRISLPARCLGRR
jgi:hypothetical protein